MCKVIVSVRGLFGWRPTYPSQKVGRTLFPEGMGRSPGLRNTMLELNE